MKKIFYFTIILLYSVYIIILFYQNQLSYYIHPRYILFTFSASLLSLVISTVGLFKSIYSLKKIKLNFATKELLTGSIFVIFIFLAFTLPVKPLSFVTANHRISDYNTLQRREANTILERFNTDTKTFSLGDWVVSLNANPDLTKYVNKEVMLSGFVLNNPDDKSSFLLSRFAITCCAVDAVPLGLPVFMEGWEEQYEENQWIEVTGKFIIKSIHSKDVLMIETTEINKIAVPNNPYIY
jgi:putative membrane protein